MILNCLLLTGVVLDIMTGLQLADRSCWAIFILPVAIQFMLVSAENHRLALASLDDQTQKPKNSLIAVCLWIIFLPLWKKFPLLLLFSLPLLTMLIATLLLFGQRPDSLVRAFTETYKGGFSQLDYQCAGVVCNGHFLCTIAAKGHPGLVKPLRVGVRAGRLIQCNRQLLVSNAFEELLEQKLPWLHRPIRLLYNKVGDGIHRYYAAFDRAWVSDAIYLLLKPLEWIFLLVLYLADGDPETRIAQQYFHPEHRRIIQISMT